MFDRVDTGAYLSGGTIAVGGTAEMMANVNSKVVDAISNKDIMDIDILLGLIPGYELHISGLIMILGLVGMILNRLDGKKRKLEREENNRGNINE